MSAQPVPRPGQCPPAGGRPIDQTDSSGSPRGVARLRTFDPATPESRAAPESTATPESTAAPDLPHVPETQTAESPGVVPSSLFERLRMARDVLHAEASGINCVARRLDAAFGRAVDALLICRGRVIVCGMGKAGLIGQKLAATLSSTGTPAHALHPGEAVHGDLGCVREGDVVLMLSNSGETEEVVRLLATLRRRGALLVAITADARSTLGRSAEVVLETGRLTEADAHGLAPSTTTTAMLALGDALALVVSRCREFTPEQFAMFHPGGSLGRKLARAADVMRPAADLRIAPATATVRDVFVGGGRPGRRTGAVLLVEETGVLCGLFTDSDLARLLEAREDARIDSPIAEVMTAEPLTIGPDTLVQEAVALLAGRKFSELPVVDEAGRPLGLVDITDVISPEVISPEVSLLPGEAA